MIVAKNQRESWLRASSLLSTRAKCSANQIHSEQRELTLSFEGKRITGRDEIANGKQLHRVAGGMNGPGRELREDYGQGVTG